MSNLGKYLFVFILFAPLLAKASHLVGGSMSYEYLGQSGSNYRYRVTLKMYRDCQTSATEFDPSITVAAYENEGNFPQVGLFEFFFTGETAVNPPQGTNCGGSLPQVCIKEAIYSQIISLPASTAGYHIVWQRCCRNTQQNLQDNVGQTYFATITPTSIVNSSPYFNGVPAPYICISDTTTYLNGATDPDGDSLSYKLVPPWGEPLGGNPQFDPPDFWSLPNTQAAYKNGFSSNLPFGANGIATVNVNNGLTTMLAPAMGLYSIAIEVTEWRNGVRLSSVRLDVQIIVVNCTPNATPAITSLSGTNTFEVVAGETVCFDVRASDGDFPFQRVKISGRGEVMGLESSWQGPKATFKTDSAQSSVTSKFCWTPSCQQVRAAPYSFVVDAIDDGCPPKSRNVAFSILVKRFEVQGSITGPAVVCTGDFNVQYSIPAFAGFKYKWVVTGGTISGPDSLNTVFVNWGNDGAGKVSLVEDNTAGCQSLPVDYNVTISPYPVPQTIANDTICEFTLKTFLAAANAGSVYDWKVTGGTINAHPQFNSIAVQWGEEGTGTVEFTETNPAGCKSDTSNAYVVLNKAKTDSIHGSQSVCPHIRGVEYFVQGPKSSTYKWFITGGTIVSGDSTDKIVVNWGGPGFGTIKMVETTKWGCVGDTVNIEVLINHVLIGFKPVGDDTVCEFTPNIPYEVVKTTGSEYYWSIQGGTLTKFDTTHTVTANWGAAQDTAKISVYEISYDSVNNIPCIGTPVSLNVVLTPLPNAGEIKGDFHICEGDGLQNYVLNGLPGSTYLWSINGDTAGIDGQGTSVIKVTWKDTGKYALKVIETSADSCVGNPIDSVIIVYPKPKTKPIKGDTIVCYPYFSGVNYSTGGFNNSVFKWNFNGGSIDTGDSTATVIISFSGQKFNLLKVVETSEAGCVGDTQKLSLFADRPYLTMRYVSVGFPDNHIVMAWELDSAPLYDKNFEIQRRVTGATDGRINTWAKAGTVGNSVFKFTDTNINTDNNAFEYRVKGTNLCGTSFYSPVHTNILLTDSLPESHEALVRWTNYKGWTDGVLNYEVYRREDYDPLMLFTRDKGTDTSDFYNDGIKNFRQFYRVKAYEDGGNSDTSWSNEIEIKYQPLLWVPNAFTPNEDGFNNIFLIGGGSIKTFEMDIFDRWGELIFHTKDLKNSWDGTYKGANCPVGVYFYRIKYTGADNMYKMQSGNITLLK